MKKAAVVAAIVLFAFSTTFAQQPKAQRTATPPAGSALEGKIREAWQAWVKKDRQGVEKILAEDAVEIWADGKGERDKKSFLQGMEERTITKYSLSDFRFTPLGSEAQLAMYRASVEFASSGGPAQGTMVVSEVWIRRGPEWKLVHYQETEVK